MHPASQKDALLKLREAEYILIGVKDKPEGLPCLLTKLALLIDSLKKMPVGEW